MLNAQLLQLILPTSKPLLFFPLSLVHTYTQEILAQKKRETETASHGTYTGEKTCTVLDRDWRQL